LANDLPDHGIGRHHLLLTIGETCSRFWTALAAITLETALRLMRRRSLFRLFKSNTNAATVLWNEVNARFFKRILDSLKRGLTKLLVFL
jgi:hypothetical protein